VVTLAAANPHPSREKAQYSLDRRMDGPQSQSECCFPEDKNAFPRLGFKPQIFQPIVWSLKTITAFLTLAFNNIYTYSQ